MANRTSPSRLSCFLCHISRARCTLTWVSLFLFFSRRVRMRKVQPNMRLSLSSDHTASTMPACCSRAHSASASAGASWCGTRRQSRSRRRVSMSLYLIWPAGFPFFYGLFEPSNMKKRRMLSFKSLRIRYRIAFSTGLASGTSASALCQLECSEVRRDETWRITISYGADLVGIQIGEAPSSLIDGNAKRAAGSLEVVGGELGNGGDLTIAQYVPETVDCEQMKAAGESSWETYPMMPMAMMRDCRCS